MAGEDNYAFNEMMNVDPDKYITGGAMEHSEYEMDMSPKQQEDFLRKNAELFMELYESDPNIERRKISFSSYLENLDPKLISMRADDYDNEPVDDTGFPDRYIMISKGIDNLSKKHYGDVDRLRNMVLGKR